MAQWKAEKKELEAKVAELEAKVQGQLPTPVTPLPVNEQVTDQPEPLDRIEALKNRSQVMGVTKPWQQMDSSAPWKMDMLKVTRRRPGFVPRWVRENKIEQRMAMGYQIADRKDYETFQNPTQFGTPEASYLMRGDLVLMEIPIEGYDAYQSAHRRRVQAASEDARKRVKLQAMELAKEQGITADDFKVTDETKSFVQ